MPVRLLLVALVERFSDLRQLQSSKHSPEQRKWLLGKFDLYKEHHSKKTLKTFFPSIYEEYFTLWPPTPTAEAIEAANGDETVASVQVRKDEQIVRDCHSPG